MLERGYAIVQDRGGAVVRESARTEVGDALRVRLHRGALRVRVDEREKE